MKHLIPFLLILIFAGCNKRQAPVPRPDGYPRLDLPAEKYRDSRGLGINTSAEIILDSVTPDGDRWLTVAYPSLNVETYITRLRVPADKLDAVLERRSERMALNTGGRETEIIEYISESGFEVTVVVTSQGASHPLQLLAVDPQGEIITATASLTDPVAVLSPDSIAPLVSLLKADFLNLIPAAHD